MAAVLSEDKDNLAVVLDRRSAAAQGEGSGSSNSWVVLSATYGVMEIAVGTAGQLAPLPSGEEGLVVGIKSRGPLHVGVGLEDWGVSASTLPTCRGMWEEGLDLDLDLPYM